MLNKEFDLFLKLYYLNICSFLIFPIKAIDRVVYYYFCLPLT